ncbi:Rrf2 family transcriptional regulator [Streptomyces qinzhouensis]|uniref:Rrf2 family transcriptional regulator n=2 Tax=Streptomyces qinzhouensis TaxID=2599401 RepID=A0A5B8JCT8_9ACTN|nr:Rrf2 family transcriptional regulator [Streptomyces qinzhouensis]QDY78244.1 Rrf2 family transcriptional regulator [Streptomyces qinzhouensis]
MSEGVEWALHGCLNLAWAEEGEDARAVPAAVLARMYELPPAYLNKQLQALARAGIVGSTSGPRGGFRLARSPREITLLDVVVAIEGADEAFRCTGILGQGPDGDPSVDYRKTCVISQTMRRAELRWRRELAGQTLADIMTTVRERFPAVPGETRDRLANLRP